jgi:hypothetical protein
LVQEVLLILLLHVLDHVPAQSVNHRFN